MSEQNKYKILICSPHNSFLEALKPQLMQDFDLQQCTTPEIAGFIAQDWAPHIALIDGDHFGNLTANLREKIGYNKLGIIVISESEAGFKEEYAFRTGADHFIAQLNDYKTLVWRVISLSRRLNSSSLPTQKVSQGPSEKPASKIQFEGLTVYPQDYLVKSADRTIKISPIQFKILVAFISHPEQLLSREWMKENVWGDVHISPRSIDAQISKLKKVLPEVGANIVNIYGQGYILHPSRNDSSLAS